MSEERGAGFHRALHQGLQVRPQRIHHRGDSWGRSGSDCGNVGVSSVRVRVCSQHQLHHIGLANRLLHGVHNLLALGANRILQLLHGQGEHCVRLGEAQFHLLEDRVQIL